MKTIILLLASFSISFTAAAQQKKSNIDNGFWVIESSIRQHKKQIVKFYDTSSRLLYEQEFENKKLKIEKPRTQKFLNGKLASLLENNTGHGSELQMGIVKKSTGN